MTWTATLRGGRGAWAAERAVPRRRRPVAAAAPAAPAAWLPRPLRLGLLVRLGLGFGLPSLGSLGRLGLGLRLGLGSVSGSGSGSGSGVDGGHDCLVARARQPPAAASALRLGGRRRRPLPARRRLGLVAVSDSASASGSVAPVGLRGLDGIGGRLLRRALGSFAHWAPVLLAAASVIGARRGRQCTQGAEPPSVPTRQASRTAGTSRPARPAAAVTSPKAAMTGAGPNTCAEHRPDRHRHRHRPEDEREPEADDATHQRSAASVPGRASGSG